jgi:hypothetical protein
MYGIEIHFLGKLKLRFSSLVLARSCSLAGNLKKRVASPEYGHAKPIATANPLIAMVCPDG